MSNVGIGGVGAASGGPLEALQAVGKHSASRTKSVGGEVPFARLFESVFSEADGLQKNASHSVDDLLSGKTDDVHRVVMDMERANLGLRLAVEVRNRALEAYQEVMRMQL